MKNLVFGFIIALLIIGGIWLFSFYYQKMNVPVIVYDTEQPVFMDIYKKTMATGNIHPRKEVFVKSSVSGILETLYVGTGSIVEEDELIAKVKVIPNTESITQAKAAVKESQLVLDNAKKQVERSSDLYNKGIISKVEYDDLVYEYHLAEQQAKKAKESLEVIQYGALQGESQVQNEIRAIISGTILELGALSGDRVIESNTFSEGTTIVSIADMNNVYFSGKVDESEVGKLKEGMPLMLHIGALEDKKIEGVLDFIAPKGVEDEGTVKFSIQASIENTDSLKLRAGYSANAEIILEKRLNTLAISEGNILFENDSTFVEVEIEEQQFEKRYIQTGLSDGLFVEIVSGVDSTDNIKVQQTISE